jgi:polyhydroxyalkanoate synthesis regulator phasin
MKRAIQVLAKSSLVWVGLFVVLQGQTLRGQAVTITAGAGLTATPNPITKVGTIAIPAAGVTNTMLSNSSVTVNTAGGSGLSGGGSLPLGGSLSLSVPAGGITNAMLSGSISPSKITGTAAILGANSFTASQSVAGNLTITGGNIHLPNTIAGGASGVLTLGGNPFLHNYGSNTGSCVVGNTFVGESAGNFFNSSTCVNGNTGIGYSALSAISTGTENTGVGYLALGRNTTGFYNTSLGFQSQWTNTTGVYNIGIGPFALSTNETGSNNIAIGLFAGTTTNFALGSNGNDNIYIGEITGDGLAGESNTIRIGNSDTNQSYQTRTFVAGISGVTTGGTAVAVVVDSNGQLGTASSSRRFKYDIRDMNEATKKLLRLRPVTFRYKQAQNDGSHPIQYGLIAEEVAKVYPELVQNTPEGQPNAVLYQVLPAMLLNEFQKQHQQIEAQQEKIRSLTEKLERQQTEMLELRGQMAAFRETLEKASGVTVANARH